jgi:hypothetical protein
VASPTGSDQRLSGFGVAVSFLAYAFVWLAAPTTYFGYLPDSRASLVFYIVAIIPLAIGIGGALTELSRAGVGHFLKVLLMGRLPNGVWGEPSSETLKYLGMTVFLLLLCALPHLIVIELFGATGGVEVGVKVVVIILLSLPTLGLAATLDELAIKPLLLIPAGRLAAFEEGYQTAGGDPGSGPRGRQLLTVGESQTSGNFWSVVKRVLATILLVGGFIQAVSAIWTAVSYIFGAR